jgi:Ca2+-binding EF-hand superfamily protein
VKQRALLGLIALAALPVTLNALTAQSRGGGGKPAIPAKQAAPSTGRTGAPTPEDDVSGFFFHSADWDRDGWIRFSEAEKSMGLDLEEFGTYDTDNDGFIDVTEFSKRYRGIVAAGGLFEPPRAKPDAPRPTKRDGKALLAAYDADLDGMLVESELGRAMVDALVADPTALVMLTTLDKDRSSGVDGAELDDLSKVLFPERERPREERARTLAELFDHSEPVDTRSGSTMGPRRTTGPISVFTRLDYDRSGGVELGDLVELQRPLRTVVRPSAILATLDRDRNGSISPAEFAAAMQ